MNLFQFLHSKTRVKEGCLFGVEIEIEREDGFSGVDTGGLSNYGVFTEDGSLRGGIEFVSGVLTPLQVDALADEYTEWAKDKGIQLSDRCSTHIHMNVQDLTAEQLTSLVWLSAAVEPLLMEFSNPQRRNNTYCVPMYNSLNLSHWYSLVLDKFRAGQQRELNDILQRAPKYAAIGGFRLREYGTLEFRMFPGLETGQQLKDWSRILEAIRQMAISTPVQDLLDLKIKKGVLSIIHPVLLNHRPDIQPDKLTALLEKGIEMANNTKRKPLTAKELLAIHRTLFPEEAPLEIISGQFGQLIMSHLKSGDDNADLTALIRKLTNDQFKRQYGGSRYQSLFVELCSLRPSDDDAAADAHVIRSVQIINIIRGIWS